MEQRLIFGVFIALAFTAIRWRWPAVPKPFATFCLVTGVGLAIWSQSQVPVGLALSLIANAAFSAATLDNVFFNRKAAALPAHQTSKVQPIPLRRLTAQEKSAITRCAIGYTNTSEAPNHVSVIFDGSSRAAKRCADDLIAAFQAANWNVTQGSVTGSSIEPASGIGLAFYDYGGLSPDQRAVKSALETANVPYDIIPMDSVARNRSVIFVTEPADF